MGLGRDVKSGRISGDGEIVKVGMAWGVRVGTGRRMTRAVEKQEKAMQEMSNRKIKPISRRPNGVRLFHVPVIECFVIIF